MIFELQQFLSKVCMEFAFVEQIWRAKKWWS